MKCWCSLCDRRAALANHPLEAEWRTATYTLKDCERISRAPEGRQRRASCEQRGGVD